MFGRLGLETARIPHVDRQGLLWLGRGKLHVHEGSLLFDAATGPRFEAGRYQIPFQNLSLILLEPGATVSHDALRLMARHGVGMIAVGEEGVRLYSAPPQGPGDSALARRHATLWAEGAQSRIQVARQMYAWRFGEETPDKRDIAILRGIEGAHMRTAYERIARQYSVTWRGRRYDRANPNAADLPNQAINHAATAIEGAAEVAVAAVGAIPALGFIHEDSANAFCLDIADLYRTEVTLPVAFGAVKECQRNPKLDIERQVRKQAAQAFRQHKLIPAMIDRIKELFNAHDGGGDS
ncbi:type I-E CRISPR-associated endonuclease Cas1e [Magnetofaba australis]|uniref:CRISPR-associated endonuclease Cas1 n=1 Tax=Magnetofaba australis IT-1 TaxID=1434232 RepID=A0A1Y2JZI9_9PROT|nr:type I-E CRISPR-associated endonuclease Cas1e [Magnetofaba australis]OSM00325.1 putative CRISPR-associated protein Cas1 [Magnetofaba australis IT-1]